MMAVVPFSQGKPSAPAGPQPSDVSMVMAAATAKQQEISNYYSSSDYNPLLRSIAPGERGRPAEVYNSLRTEEGLSPDEARARLRKGYKETNPGMTDDDIDRIQERMPGS